MLRDFKNWLSRKKATTRCCCFHFGRCGSTLLGNLLNAHRQIEWHSELFHPLHEKTDQLQPFNDPMELLTVPLAECRAPTFGFETKFQHLDKNGLNRDLKVYLHQLMELGFDKFVVLKRKNYLRQAISVARGQRTGQWHHPANQPRPKFEPFRLDPDAIALGGFNREILDCFRFLDQTYQRIEDLFAELKTPFLQLEYESDLESSAQQTGARMHQFLNVAQQEARVSVKQLGGQAIEQMITNRNEIEERLADTEYQWMLD